MSPHRTHRFCRSPHHLGPRWISHVDFYVKVWGDPPHNTWPAQLQSECHACQRQRARINRAKARGHAKPYATRQPSLSREERNRRKRIHHAKRMKTDKKYVADRRQQSRENAAIRRRQDGVPVRGQNHKYRDVPSTRDTLVNAEPLLRWLEPYIAEYDTYVAKPAHLRSEIGARAKPALGSSDRQILRSIEKQGRVTITVVDRLFQQLGHPYLTNTLYPPTTDN